TPADDTPTVMRFKNQYIMLPTKSGLLIIDQHRAHIKVLYERYLALVNSGHSVSQSLLFPESVTLTAAQNVAVEASAEQIAKCGFDMSYLGACSWAINGVPPMVANSEAVETVMKIVENITDLGEEAASDVVNSKIALTMAQSTAIRAGQQITDTEAETLVNDLLQLPAPNFTPDGQVVLAVVPTADIQRLFSI
ncbi:MAG: DNA mismatch repair protein MutL, partial [Muribaculaceae bacterium]|nr:DNA mismatch repair protein MutL [Muribaculaceae bacterium]